MVTSRAIWAVGALCLAACGQADETASQATNAASSAVPAPPSPPAPEPGVARKVTRTTSLIYYSYPAAAAAIVPLKAWLDADSDKQQTRLAKEAWRRRQRGQE
jgi:hypothetical protein